MLYSYYTILYSSLLSSEETVRVWHWSFLREASYKLSTLSVTNLNVDWSKRHLSLFCCNSLIVNWNKAVFWNLSKMGDTWRINFRYTTCVSVLLLRLTIELSLGSRSGHVTNNRCLGRGQSEYLLTSTTQIKRWNVHDEKPAVYIEVMYFSCCGFTVCGNNCTIPTFWNVIG